MTKKSKKYSLEQLTQVAFNIIGFAGNAKSEGMEAIYEAKKYNFKLAEEKLISGNEELVNAEKQHFEIIHDEANGIEINIPLILMHAEDQIFSAQTILTIAQEIIDLYKIKQEIKK